MRYSILLALVFSFSLCAAPVTPKLVNSLHAACLLAGDPAQLRCWSLTGGALPTPELAHPVDVAAGNDSICAIDDGHVVCWIDGEQMHHHWFQIDQHLQAMLGGLEHAQAIVAGDWDSYCVWDETAGFRCANGWIQRDTTTEIPSKDAPLEMAVGSAMTCAIQRDQAVHCWGPFDSLETTYDAKAPELLTVPADLKQPHDLTLSFGTACVLDGNERRCWGKKGETRSPAPGLYPYQATPGFYLDQHRVHGDSRFDKFEGALLASSRGQQACVANAKEIQCNYTYPLPFALSYSPPGLMAALFSDAAAHTYEAHRAPYEAALEGMRSIELADKVFEFNLLAPLVTGTQSDYFQKALVPLYEEARQYWQPRFPAHPRTTQEIDSALRIAVACLPEGTDWYALKAALGTALAEHGDASALAELNKTALQAPLSTLDAPMGATLQTILNWLKL